MGEGLNRGLWANSPERVAQVATPIVDAAFRGHPTLGPGLRESIYAVCLV